MERESKIMLSKNIANLENVERRQKFLDLKNLELLSNLSYEGGQIIFIFMLGGVRKYFLVLRGVFEMFFMSS